MAEFKEPIPHTGGVLIIHKTGNQYSLGYHHMNPKRAVLTQILAENGETRAIVPAGGLYLNREPPPPRLLTMLPSDGDGMYGRVCPSCRGYFRANHISTEFCPYCDVRAPWIQFLTANQVAFVKKQYEAILAALKGPDGDTSIDFDAQVASPPPAEATWVYEEEKQQTHFKCPRCEAECDVLGDYVRCPGCGSPTLRAVFLKRLQDALGDFEHDAANIPKGQRSDRERRWREYVPRLVAEFEGLGRNAALSLARLPSTDARRTAVLGLSFQNLVDTSDRIRQWFDIDVYDGLAPDDVRFVVRLFNRRHLFQHNAGRVDEEYLARTADDSVRLHEVVRVRSSEVRRLLELVRLIATNLIDGVEGLNAQRG